MKQLLCVIVAVNLFAGLLSADVTVVRDGSPVAAIFVSARVMDDSDANPEPPSIWRQRTEEDHRRRLRESVKDLAGILGRISDTQVPIVVGQPQADDERVPILIGEVAEQRFGKVAKSYAFDQGFRTVVSGRGIGLIGESDLATSYAIYSLLHDLGCRWFMPSQMGEVLPSMKTITFKTRDDSSGPYTYYRGIWYCDNDFARRNRMGGMQLAAGHALEGTVPKALRETNPQIRAIIKGEPHRRKVKWTHPLVAKSIADVHLSRLEKDPTIPTFSLSPDDGIGWDESDDTKYDTGDFDTATQTVSKTDRLLVLTRRVAQRVTAKYPDVKFGVLAYADYIRPPLREKVHPAVVPQIAPITFSRAHPMTDEGEPNNESLRYLVRGWGKAAPATSYYFYGFYLAEVSSPNPMIHKWSVNIPIVYDEGNCRYWQPETITNFETSMHAHYLGLRMAWDPSQDPATIINELHAKMYGNAAKHMAAYWHHIDETWTAVPEYAGCGFGHLRRWTKARLKKARSHIDAAFASCKTEREMSCVRMVSESLAGFETFMKLRRDLAEGRFASLAADAERYRKRMNELGERYQSQFAFSKMRWTRDRTLAVRYFDAFYKRTCDDASRIAKGFNILNAPINTWRIHVDPPVGSKKGTGPVGEGLGWCEPGFDDSEWRTTNCVVDTWSRLGLHNYMGSLWYRTRVSINDVDRGRRVYLWIGATDGRVKVFVNGKHVLYVNDKGESADTFTGHCRPASFDITGVLSDSGENQISLLCTREFLNELGTGGLLAPAMIYQVKSD